MLTLCTLMAEHQSFCNFVVQSYIIYWHQWQKSTGELAHFAVSHLVLLWSSVEVDWFFSVLNSVKNKMRKNKMRNGMRSEMVSSILGIPVGLDRKKHSGQLWTVYICPWNNWKNCCFQFSKYYCYFFTCSFLKP